MTPSLTLLNGDARTELKQIPDGTVQCCVTSPPYFGLRDYKVAGQIGLEQTPELYVAELVAVFREVRRVLRDDGTLWLNLGDSYAGSWGNYGGQNRTAGKQRAISAGSRVPNAAWDERTKFKPPGADGFEGVKPKDLIGIPWMVAFALRADGWYLRQDIIWSKPNPMPESVQDRCTKSHEYIFLLTKSARYYYDAAAIAEPASGALYDQVEEGYNGEGTKDYTSNGVQNPSGVKARIIANARKRADQFGGNKHNGDTTQHSDGSIYTGKLTRNKRSVWTVPTACCKEAHFATFPPDLIRPCILAGSRAGDTVLDPFGGSGTTGQVALEEGRNVILIELNPDYCALIRHRTNVTPGLALV